MNPNTYQRTTPPLLPAQNQQQVPPQTQQPTTPGELRQQLGQALSEAQDILFKATTVFPFTLFPDLLAVDRTKVTISHRWFFKMAETVSIRIEDILNVTANVGPFFGSLKIQSRIYNEQTPYEVDWLSRSDALRAKRVLQGYVIALKRQIDCTSLSAAQLAQMLDELGKTSAEEV